MIGPPRSFKGPWFAGIFEAKGQAWTEGFCRASASPALKGGPGDSEALRSFCTTTQRARTGIVRRVAVFTVPRGARGARLESADEIVLGDARVRVKFGPTVVRDTPVHDTGSLRGFKARVPAQAHNLC